jgi:hypothetical protein
VGWERQELVQPFAIGFADDKVPLRMAELNSCADDTQVLTV